MESASKKLIVALDGLDLADVSSVVKACRPYAETFKIGLSLFMAHGLQVIDIINGLGVKIFLDLKFHDIPMQVANAVSQALKFAPRFLTVHAQGGEAMLKEVADVARGSSTQILAVSVLTSLSDKNFNQIGYSKTVAEGVLHLAELALLSGIQGLVSSPHELKILRQHFGNDLYLVSPGIRCESVASDDQSRVMSAFDAIRSGANALVVGRPITASQNYALAAQKINQAIVNANSSVRREL